ncbi:hypothetical protein AB0N64_14555 [Microbacterium sp. NPDC089318]
MTDTTTPDDLDAILAADTTETASARRIPEPGEQVHALRSGIVLHLGGGGPFSSRSVTLERGQTFTITSALLDANRDRHGSLDGSILSLVKDPDAQRTRYGDVLLAPGPAPDDMRPWVYGDPLWEVQRDTARRRAYALPSEAERRDALAEMEREYGPARLTSQTTRTIRPGAHPTERASAAQAEQIRRGIVDGTH